VTDSFVPGFCRGLWPLTLTAKEEDTPINNQ